MDEKSYQIIIIIIIKKLKNYYNTKSYKTLIIGKPLRFRFDKLDGFLRVYDGTRYVILFGPEKYDGIYDRIIPYKSNKLSYTCYFS